MSKATLAKVRSFCKDKGYGRGYKKLLCLEGTTPATRLRDYHKWWKGPGTYVIQVWPPAGCYGAPRYKLTLKLGNEA